MEIGNRILLDLFVIYGAAVVGGAIASRLRKPPVIGELVAGVVIGPHALGLAGEPNAALVAAFGSTEAARLALEGAYAVLAEFGLVLLLFFVGLELRIGELLAVGRRAALVGFGGIVLPFASGYTLATLLGWETIEAIFLAAALVSTSTGITARVLRDLGVIASTEARIILAAAVIDDILSMIVIAVTGSLGERGEVSLQGILFLVVEVAVFIVFVTLVGTRVIQRFGTGLAAPDDTGNHFVAAIVLCFGLAVLASSIGMAPIIGAFLAGLVIGESWDAHSLTKAALPVYRLLVPFFFVITGMRVDPTLLIEPTVAGLAALITVVAIVSKLVSGMLGSVGLGLRSALIIGVGMVPRGEIGFVVVGMGRSLGALPEQIVSVVVVMTVVTTLIVPPILGILYQGPELPRPWGRLLPLPWRPLLPLPSGASLRDFTGAGRLPGLGPGPRARPRRSNAHAAGDPDGAS
jgi:Kef-type K+ transport system membrane component KefB